MIFFCLSGAVVFSVQSIGRASKSIPSFIVAAVIRVALNYLLVSDVRFNIYGAAFSDIVAYAVILVCNMHIISKYAGVKYGFIKCCLNRFSAVLCPMRCRFAHTERFLIFRVNLRV